MRWPWQRTGSSDRLVVSWSGQTLAYVLARARADGTHAVLKFGVEHQGSDGVEDLLHRLQALGLKGLEACVMLRPEQYQLLQIDTPAVAPEELRSAARYQIREMLHTHVDDVTLDVMRVGDGKQKGQGHLFVMVVPNALVRNILGLGESLHWTVPVIDVQETAQRNLQNALAARDGRPERANAALVLVQGQQALLTISANEELFYTRRFELPPEFLAGSWEQGSDHAPPLNSGFAPVDEYVPDYSVDGISYGTDYSDPRAGGSDAPGVGAGEDESSQRFLVEVQRSLDVWERSWSSMPLDRLWVYAGDRSRELSAWLALQLGQKVVPLDVNALFPGFEAGTAADQARCLPLLGVLMRSESRKL